MVDYTLPLRAVLQDLNKNAHEVSILFTEIPRPPGSPVGNKYNVEPTSNKALPGDETSFVAEQEYLCESNLPLIMGTLMDPRKIEREKHQVDETNSDVWGRPMRVFPPWLLPSKVSVEVEGWRLDYWMSVGAPYGLTIRDVVARIDRRLFEAGQGLHEFLRNMDALCNKIGMRRQRYKSTRGVPFLYGNQSLGTASYSHQMLPRINSLNESQLIHNTIWMPETGQDGKTYITQPSNQWDCKFELPDGLPFLEPHVSIKHALEMITMKKRMLFEQHARSKKITHWEQVVLSDGQKQDARDEVIGGMHGAPEPPVKSRKKRAREEDVESVNFAVQQPDLTRSRTPGVGAFGDHSNSFPPDASPCDGAKESYTTVERGEQLHAPGPCTGAKRQRRGDMHTEPYPSLDDLLAPTLTAYDGPDAMAAPDAFAMATSSIPRTPSNEDSTFMNHTTSLGAFSTPYGYTIGPSSIPIDPLLLDTRAQASNLPEPMDAFAETNPLSAPSNSFVGNHATGAVEPLNLGQPLPLPYDSFMLDFSTNTGPATPDELVSSFLCDPATPDDLVSSSSLGISNVMRATSTAPTIPQGEAYIQVSREDMEGWVLGLMAREETGEVLQDDDFAGFYKQRS